MASGIGLGRMMQGAVEGLDKTEARRDRETQRGREDTQWEQGQEDREYSLTRQTIDDSRSDEQYQIQKDKQTRFKSGNEALRGWMTTGEIDGINGYMNEYTPEGLDHELTKNEDGTYTAVMKFDGREESKAISEQEIGTYMQVLMTQDPYAKLTEQQNAKKAADVKKEDRAFDMKKLEKEYELKRGIEHIKGSYKKDGKGGKGSSSMPAYQKELADLSKEKYGGSFANGMWSFDSTRKERMSATHADLAGAYYMAGEGDTNTAHRQASRAMSVMEQRAAEQADAELDEGTIDKKQYELRVADIVDHYTDLTIKKMAPTPGETLQRGGGQPAPKSDTGTEIPLEAIQQLKDDPSDEMKKFFDDTFGPGSADSILGGDEMNPDPTANAGVTGEGGGGPALIREANAAGTPKEVEKAQQEEEKPTKLSRGQRRREGKESRKAHGKIAVSEYKNEWVNMEDQDKLDWWTDNASALKAASPRSHKKANKEIIEIRNKSKIGRMKR